VDPPGGIPCQTVLPRVLQGPQRASPVGGLATGVLPRRARRRPRVPVQPVPDPVRRIKPRPSARLKVGHGPRAQAVCGGPSSCCATRLSAVAAC